jgi:hypothetical protein
VRAGAPASHAIFYTILGKRQAKSGGMVNLGRAPFAMPAAT